MRFEPGEQCTVNGMGDLAMDVDMRILIGADCIIVKRTKSGLIQVALEWDPKYVRSVPQRNIQARES